MRRFEAKHLVLFRQRRLDLRQRRAGARRDDQLGRFIGLNAAVPADVERPAGRLVAVKRLRAAADDGKRRSMRCRLAYRFGKLGGNVSFLSHLSFFAPSRLCVEFLKPFEIGEGDLPAMHVHAPELGAARECRHRLARIEDTVGVEGVLESVKLGEFFFRELHAHLIDLLDADAVFAGDGATDRDAEFKNFSAQFLGTFQVAGFVGVVKNQRVQVAVAGVEHVRHRQAVLARQPVNAGQHLGDVPARNGAVHAVVVGREAPDGGKSRLAAGPHPEAFGFILGRAHFGGALPEQQFAHPRDALRDLLVGAVEFAQQDGRGLDRIADLDVVLGRADGGVVHYFKSGGGTAAGNDGGDGVAGLLNVVEGREHDLRALGVRQELDGDLDNDAEHAFGTGHQREQIVARRVERLAAERNDLAVRGQDLEADDVVDRETVFQAVHAAGVLGDVAADGAGDLRRRVGRVIQAIRRGRLGDGEIAHAGLDSGGAIQGIDFKDAVELREREQHALGMRQRAAGKAGAGAARDHGDTVLMAQQENAPHLFEIFR